MNQPGQLAPAVLIPSSLFHSFAATQEGMNIHVESIVRVAAALLELCQRNYTWQRGYLVALQRPAASLC
jgi:hypothetical protein